MDVDIKGGEERLWHNRNLAILIIGMHVISGTLALVTMNYHARKLKEYIREKAYR
jgi:hypothetical protein